MSEHRRNILEDSWVDQEKRQEILEEAIARGLQAQCQTFIAVVHNLFPQLSELASQRIAGLDDPDALCALIVSVACAHDIEDARGLLTRAGESS